MAFDAFAAQLWTSLPGIIQSFDPVAQTCTIVPAVQGAVITPSGEVQLVDLPVLVDCPVLWPNGGGFTLTFPIEPGDEGLIMFASRCIDSWWESGSSTPVPPAEIRFHDLSDGFVMVGPRSLPKAISGVSTTSTQLRKDDGTAYVEISDNGDIKLKSPTLVTIDSPQTICTGTLTVEGLLTYQDGMTGAGGGDITGTVTVTSGDVVADSKSLKTHTHGGVTTGGGNTGAPN